MNSLPQHLLSEDRQEYERILTEALRSTSHRADLAAVGERLNAEQLRTMALSATPLITAAAATEYQHYVEVREQLRRPASSTPSSREGTSGPTAPAGAAVAPTMGEVAETAGAGAGAVVAVLAGTAAALFLLVGYALKMLEPEPGVAETLTTTGWVFGAVTAAAILVAAVGLLLTALRNGAHSLDARARGELTDEVAQAREAWREALLERGIMPFLREALAGTRSAAANRTPPASPRSRIPHLGYHRPGFSSPEGGPAAGPRTSFSSPDFTSPDFGGPEHRTG